MEYCTRVMEQPVCSLSLFSTFLHFFINNTSYDYIPKDIDFSLSRLFSSAFHLTSNSAVSLLWTTTQSRLVPHKLLSIMSSWSHCCVTYPSFNMNIYLFGHIKTLPVCCLLTYNYFKIVFCKMLLTLNYYFILVQNWFQHLETLA